MTDDLQALLDVALTLPKRERVELVSELLESLDAPADVEAAWTTEIRKRLADLRSGNAELVDWADARAEIHRSRQ